MMKWFARFGMLLLLLATFVLSPGVHAQQNITLSSLEVDFWPEYDQPQMLVIYRVTLPPSVSLPADLTFRIPAAAGDPSAVAVRQMTSGADAGLFTIPYERQVSGSWGMISLTATMPELQIEYYDPALTFNGGERTYAYQWPGDYAVDNMLIQVQQPVNASGMQISPATDGGVRGQDGLVYFNKQVGTLPSGQSFDLEISYQKDDDSLSIASLQVQPSAPVAEVPTGQIDMQALLPWVLGLLGVALIVGGGVWYWRSGQGSSAKSEKPRRRRSTSARQDVVSSATEGHIYCHECGKRASAGDRFCRSCGTRLRTE